MLDPRLERPYRMAEWREYHEAQGGDYHSDEEDLGYILGGNSDDSDEHDGGAGGDGDSSDEEGITNQDDMLTVIEGYQALRTEHGVRFESLELQPVAMLGFRRST